MTVKWPQFLDTGGSKCEASGKALAERPERAGSLTYVKGSAVRASLERRAIRSLVHLFAAMVSAADIAHAANLVITEGFLQTSSRFYDFAECGALYRLNGDNFFINFLQSIGPPDTLSVPSWVVPLGNPVD